MNKPVTPARGFSDRWLNSVKPIDRRFEVPDKACRGLRLRVEKSGSKSFVWYYRNDLNKTVGYVIGRYPDISLAKAREELLSLQSLKRTGKIKTKSQLREEAEELKQAELADQVLVSEVADEFYDHILQERKRPDVVKQMIEADIKPSIGSKPIKAVTEDDVREMIESIKGRGAMVHSGKVFSITKQMFRWAKNKKHVPYSVIADIEKKNDLNIKVVKRTRVLDFDAAQRPVEGLPEMTAFWQALDKAPKLSLQIKTALRVLLLTGVRSSEIRLATWEEFDLKKAEWTIP